MLYMVKGSTEHMAADHPLVFFGNFKTLRAKHGYTKVPIKLPPDEAAGLVSFCERRHRFGIALLLQGPAKTNITFEFESAT